MQTASPQKTIAAARSPVIVLAEDDPALRELIAGALELDGHRAVKFAAGNALMATVRR